jgi:hypothetical protein
MSLPSVRVPRMLRHDEGRSGELRPHKSVAATSLLERCRRPRRSGDTRRQRLHSEASESIGSAQSCVEDID